MAITKYPTMKLILRASSREGHFPGSLSLRIIHERRVKTLALSCRLYAEEWDPINQQIIYPKNPKRIRELERLEDNILSIFTTLEGLISSLEKQGRYSVDDILLKYRQNKDNGKLLGWVETLVRDLLQTKQDRLARAYRTVSRGLVQFNEGKDIPLKDINSSLIKLFEKDLKDRGKMPNTISYYMRNLRSIYNKAIARKRLKSRAENPFHGVYSKVKPTTKRALTAEESTRFYQIDFAKLRSLGVSRRFHKDHVDSLYVSWRLYMFCFLAQGMCFIDASHLRKSDIRDGLCTYYRKKTGHQIQLSVNQGMQKIIDSFSSEVCDSPYVFPILKNKQGSVRYETALRLQNSRLKDLGRLAHIDKRITTHVARHSFATLVRSGGIPMGVISEMLGHSTEKMTHNYLASFDRSCFDRAYDVINSILVAG